MYMENDLKGDFQTEQKVTIQLIFVFKFTLNTK